MAKKRVRRRGGSGYFLPGIGYVSREEQQIALRIARKYRLSAELGLDCNEQAKREIIAAIRTHRALSSR